MNHEKIKYFQKDIKRETNMARKKELEQDIRTKSNSESPENEIVISYVILDKR